MHHCHDAVGPFSRRRRTAMARVKARRQVTGLLLVCVALLTSLGLSAPAAAASPSALIDCPGYATQQFSPGLRLLPQPVSFHAEGPFGPCVTTSPDHVFADYEADGQALLSCSVSLPVTGVSGTVRWKDASGDPSGTSHFDGGISLTQRPTGQNVVVVLATITAGDFAGDQILYEIVLLNTDLLACLTTGITQVAGPANLTVLPL
ncbi:hypothetical protein [uncultured Streptomyces sp.]|uniref:hypothetical protein n=1 Tax=uncultured Streptomyces sp. TaxID=174707 RepID=UPI0026225AF1|nr:hypothetical protein [uncultured Streptomyces sp.]